MKKLIFFDIDGTIITDGPGEHIIPGSFPETLSALQKNGHLCFINTGRAFSEVDDVIRRLPFDGYICGCGTYIEYKGKTLYSYTIPFETGNEILRSLNDCHLSWLLEGTRHVYYSSLPYQTRIQEFKDEHSRMIPEAFRIITPEQERDIEFDKFCICLDKNHQFDKFYEQYKGILTFIDRKGGFYEIVPKGHSKASGIAFLENYNRVRYEDTISNGDSANDLPMLEYTGVSIAKGNSSSEVFDIADYVTDYVMEDGIYHGMNHLGLI